MLLYIFFRWWYVSGWLSAIKDIKKSTVGVSHAFSIPILIKSLFAPWRRLVTYPGKSLDEKFHAAVDNLISRFVGFGVRITALITASIMCVLTFCLFVVVAIIWPLIPLSAILLIYIGIAG